MDVLSGTASAISIASAVVHIAQGVYKIRVFIRTLEEAPQDMIRILRSLEILGSILKHVQEVERPCRDDLYNTVVLECNACAQDVQTSIDDIFPALLSGKKPHRRWASFKALQRAKAIRRLEDRLERAKTTLVLAAQVLSRDWGVQCRNYQDVSRTPRGQVPLRGDVSYADKLDSYYHHYALPHGVETLKIADSSLPCLPPLLGPQSSPCLAQGRSESAELNKMIQRHVSSQTEALISMQSSTRHTNPSVGSHSKSWGRSVLNEHAMAHEVWEDCIEDESETWGSTPKSQTCYQSPVLRSQSLFKSAFAFFHMLARGEGWKIVLDIPRLVRDDAPIFVYSRRGDIAGVRWLLAQHEASVLDIDSTGASALHFAAENHHPALCQLLIDNSADVDAKDLSAWHQTPFARACRGFDDCVQYLEDATQESRQMQTFRRLQAGGFDLCDAEQEQRIHQLAAWDNERALLRRGGSRINFEFPSQWIFNQMLGWILSNPAHYDVEFWSKALGEALLRCPGSNPCIDILRHCPPEAVKNRLIAWIDNLDADQQWVPGPNGTIKDLRAMLARIQTLHYTEYSPYLRKKGQLTTPTRSAMRGSRAFFRWRMMLQELGVNLYTFATVEAPLINDGWTPCALSKLLEAEYTSSEDARRIQCRYCASTPPHVAYFWDPLWHMHVERIKNEVDLSAPLSVDEVHTEKRWRKYVTLYRKELMCYICFKRFEEEADPEVESVPGLLEINV